MEHMVGQLLALIVALCWAQNSLIYSFTGRAIGSKTVAHIRLWIALPLILIAHYLFVGSWFPVGFSSSTYILLAISGIIGFFIADLLIFQSFVLLGPRETLVILTSSPIFIVILSSIYLDESIVLVQIIGIIITVAGVMWVVFTEAEKRAHSHTPKGILIAFSGSLTQAIAMVLSKAGMVEGIHPISANLIRLFAGFIGLVLFVSVRGEFLSDFRKVRSVKLIGLIASAALVGPIIGIALTLYAITLAPVGVVTAISQISPILLLPIERFIFKRHIGISTIAGTLLAIAGTVVLLIG